MGNWTKLVGIVPRLILSIVPRLTCSEFTSDRVAMSATLSDVGQTKDVI